MYDKKLFPDGFIKNLEKIRISIKKNLSDNISQSGKSFLRGNLEFEGYIPYSIGDDIRYIDWNLYARSDKLVIKKYKGESLLNILILIDSSNSMSIGKNNKFDFSLHLSAGISFVALKNACALKIGIIKPNEIEYSNIFLKKKEFPLILKFLSKRKPEGKITNLFKNIKLNKKTFIIFISDLFDIEKKISLYDIKKHKIFLYHILCKEDYEPFFNNSLSIIDSETNEKASYMLNNENIYLYKQCLDKQINKWKLFCKKNNITYFLEYSQNTIKNALEKLLF